MAASDLNPTTGLNDQTTLGTIARQRGGDTIRSSSPRSLLTQPVTIGGSAQPAPVQGDLFTGVKGETRLLIGGAGTGLIAVIDDSTPSDTPSTPTPPARRTPRRWRGSPPPRRPASRRSTSPSTPRPPPIWTPGTRSLNTPSISATAARRSPRTRRRSLTPTPTSATITLSSPSRTRAAPRARTPRTP